MLHQLLQHTLLDEHEARAAQDAELAQPEEGFLKEARPVSQADGRVGPGPGQRAARGHLGVDRVDAPELERALRIAGDLIGVNNRNLKTLAVDLATTEQLAPKVPRDRVLVAESGLGSSADLARMARVGASAFLIGESFMRKPDVEAAVREILAKKAA